MALFLLSYAVILSLPHRPCRRRVRAWGLSLTKTVFPAAMFLVPASVSGLAHARDEGPAAESDAARLYRRYCQRCHGADGAGGRGADDIPNFTKRAWQEKRDDAELLVSILDGKGRGMPAFQDRLNETQARALVAHIRAFDPPSPTAPAKGPSSARVEGNSFAAQFRQLQNEFEALQRQVQKFDSIPQRQSEPSPHTGERRTSPEVRGPQGEPSEMTPGTHKRDSSTVDGHRRASADDQQEPRKSAELATGVHALFSAKCASCHGADLPRPKGKFGYVLDLERVRGNSKLLVPGKPDKSKLWALIRDDEMPPEGDPVGPLTLVEKALVEDWIVAGAPAAVDHSPAADGDPPARSTVPSPPPAVATPYPHHLLDWLGRFHIPTIHLPIALFVAAAAGEFWCLLWRIRDPWLPVRFCVLLGAAGSALAAALGWLHADFGGHGAGSPALLSLHRWLGTLGSGFAATAAVASEIDFRRGRRSPLCSLLLFAATTLIGAAGHFGGSLVHGDDFFAW